MNVLIVTPYYFPNIVGGAEISSQLIAEGLTKRGHQVYVLTLGETFQLTELNNVHVITINNSKMYGIWYKVLNNQFQTARDKLRGNVASLFVDRNEVKRLKELLSERKYNIAIMNSNEECFQRASLWKALYDSGIPSILTLRDPLLVEKKIGNIDVSFLYKYIIKRQLRWITKYAAPSKYMFEYYEKEGFRFNNKKVIYNSIDIEIDKAAKIKKDYIIYAGGVVEKKGVLTLLSAFKIVRSAFPGYKLIYIGRGDLAEQLASEENVMVIPWIEKEQLYEYMQEAKVLVLPSEWPEAFGRVLIEAVFNGTLAIGSSAGAIPEIFDDEVEYVYKEKDFKALAEKIIRIIRLEDNDYYEKVESLQKKWSHFKLENHIDNWEEYIQN